MEDSSAQKEKEVKEIVNERPQEEETDATEHTSIAVASDIDGPVPEPLAAAPVSQPAPQQAYTKTVMVPMVPRIENTYAKTLRSIILKTLLGATVGVAVITVILILIGSWSDTTWRAIWTMVVAIIHLLIVLGLASSTIYARSERAMRSSNGVLNTSLIVTVVSFFVTIASIWLIIPGGDLWRWYMSFAVVIFAALHIKAFYDLEEVPTVRNLLFSYYGVICFTAVIMMSWILIHTFGAVLDGFLVRLVAATIVANVTMGIVIAVMRRMYYQQHPELRSAQVYGSNTTLIVTLVIVISVLIYGAPSFISLLLH